MNKKISIVAPISLLSTIICSSCGGNIFVRHTFKDTLTKEQFKERLNAINNEQIDKETELLKINTEKGKFSSKYYLSSNVTQNSIQTQNNYSSEMLDGSYCEKNRIFKINEKIKSNDGKSDISSFYKVTKLDEEERLFNAQIDNITGTKNKKMYNKEIDSKSKIIDVFNSFIGIGFLRFLYPVFDYKFNNLYTAFDLCGQYDYDDEVSFINFSELFPSKSGDIKYAKNDDKSLMFSFKTQLNYVDYIKKIIDEETLKEIKAKDISGTVDVDLFYCLENNFLTQIDAKIKISNAKITINKFIREEKYKDKEYKYVVNQEVSLLFNIDYNSGNDFDVNLDEFSEIKN